MQASSTGLGSRAAFLAAEDPELLIRDPGWEPPPNACQAALGLPAGGAATAEPFGAPFHRHFLIDFSQWTFINHGEE